MDYLQYLDILQYFDILHNMDMYDVDHLQHILLQETLNTNTSNTNHLIIPFLSCISITVKKNDTNLTLQPDI